MKILISTTKNQPPTASLFLRKVNELGHEVEFWFPESESLRQMRFDYLIPLYTALNYDDSDLDQILSHQDFLETNSLNAPESLRLVRGKERQMKMFEDLGLPHIFSLSIVNEPMKTRPELELLFASSGKIVVKPFRSNKGLGVSVYDDLEDLFRRLEEDFKKSDQRWLIQPWVKNKGETRILFLDSKPFLSFYKKSESDSLLNNLNQGSSITDIPLHKLDSELLEMAKSVASHTKLNWFAIDFLDTESGPVCLEVNTSPGLVLTSEFYKRDFVTEILKHEIKE